MSAEDIILSLKQRIAILVNEIEVLTEVVTKNFID